MRYRRYYSQKNPDGSRTVVSAGPLFMAWAGIGRFVITCVFLTWPLDAIYYWRSGKDLRWVVGIPAAILWLVIVVGIYNAYKRSQTPPK